MKKFLAGLFAGIIIASSVSVFAGTPIKILVNGKEVRSDVTPVILQGRTMVPVRFIAQALGAKVDWDEKTSTVIIKTANYVEPNPNIPTLSLGQSIEYEGISYSIDSVQSETIEGKRYLSFVFTEKLTTAESFLGHPSFNFDFKLEPTIKNSPQTYQPIQTNDQERIVKVTFRSDGEIAAIYYIPNGTRNAMSPAIGKWIVK